MPGSAFNLEGAVEEVKKGKKVPLVEARRFALKILEDTDRRLKKEGYVDLALYTEEDLADARREERKCVSVLLAYIDAKDYLISAYRVGNQKIADKALDTITELEDAVCAIRAREEGE
jgi:hypothetical protein